MGAPYPYGRQSQTMLYPQGSLKRCCGPRVLLNQLKRHGNPLMNLRRQESVLFRPWRNDGLVFRVSPNNRRLLQNRKFPA